MDDNFNTNNIPGGDTAPQTPQTPPMQQNTVHTDNAPSGNGQYSAPYNTAYNQQGQYGQSRYTQTQYTGQPYNTNPSQYGNPAYTQRAYTVPNKPNKKKNAGRNLFVALICVCIVIASVAIGFSVTGNKDNTAKTEQSSDSGNSAGKNNGSGAVAKVEDSPVSFSEYSGNGAMTPEQIYDVAKEINVGVIVYSQNQKVGEGSGIIVGEDEKKENTYILTAAHVISDKGVSVQIQFSDESEIEAEIVGYDTKTDIGVLRVKKTGFTPATFGNSDKLTVGQKVYAIGNPGGTVFFGSFTNGIISAIDRPVASSTSAYDLPCIQHNAAINPGNSGGALLNEYGQVIGLNSSKISSTDYEGMGFAVPSKTMLEIYNDIIANGYVTNRPMLGITYYSVASDYTYSAIAWQNNIPYGSVVVASINDSSDLQNNGVKVGDIITAVNGKALSTTDVLLEAIENSKVGDTLTLSICRLNNSGSVSSTFDVKVKLVEDKGETSIVPEEQTTNPFNNYFGGGFGY